MALIHVGILLIMVNLQVFGDRDLFEGIILVFVYDT
jgi:hypothetical protein